MFAFIRVCGIVNNSIPEKVEFPWIVFNPRAILISAVPSSSFSAPSKNFKADKELSLPLASTGDLFV